MSNILDRTRPWLKLKAREKIEEIKEKMYVLDKYQDRFPKVEKEAVYLTDPTYTLKEDIRNQNGNIIFV